MKGEVIKRYLDRFPNARTNTLALLIYKDNKELFTDKEAVRTLIRYYRGQNGAKQPKEKSYLKEAEPMPRLPEGLTTLDNWGRREIKGTHKVLIMGDIHIPFHDKQSVELAVKYGVQLECDIVILNGDIFDFYALSRWEKDPRKRDFAMEIDYVRQFLEYLRSQFPKAKIIFKEGNHEERWYHYMQIKAPELLLLPEFEFPKILDFRKYKIEFLGEKRPLKLNELYVLHGHEYKFAISNPVNPARGLYLRAKKNALCGHFHQSSNHSEPDLDDKVTSTWSVGCLSELHPRYMPLNKWNHGFAYVETEGRKLFNVHNLKIINGEVRTA